LRLHSNSRANHAEGVYIINSAGIAYHQNAVLYIIIAKENTPFGDDIPLLSQWIKKIDRSKPVDFWLEYS